MGSIWKPTVRVESYRGNIQSHHDFWAPNQTPDLYHYGRKGMKWYQHIFGKFNLKTMGTGVGNLLDEEKIKEIARKLGIPLNQISQKMGVIREYFMKERQQQIGTSNPPAYEKTQRDAREIKKVADSIKRDVSARNWERASQDIALEKRRLGRLDEYDHRFEPPEVKEARRKRIEAEEQAEVDRRRETVRYNQRKQQEYEARQEERARAAEELKQKRMKEGLESLREEDRAKAVRREMQKEQEQKAKEQRRQEFIEEQMEEQRRKEEEEYERFKKQFTPKSGGGHKF